MFKKPVLFFALLISALSLSSLANENNDPVENRSHFVVGPNSWQLLKKAKPELFLGVLGNAKFSIDAERFLGTLLLYPSLNGQWIMSNGERPSVSNRLIFAVTCAIIVIDKASLAQIDQPLARSITAKMSSDDMVLIEEEYEQITINVLTPRKAHYALLQSVSTDKENPFSVAAMEKELANLPHAGLDMVEVLGDMAAAKMNEAADKRSANADVTEVYRAVRAALK